MTMLDPSDPAIQQAVDRMLDDRALQIYERARVECAEELQRAGYSEAADYLRRTR